MALGEGGEHVLEALDLAVGPVLVDDADGVGDLLRGNPALIPLGEVVRTFLDVPTGPHLVVLAEHGREAPEERESLEPVPPVGTILCQANLGENAPAVEGVGLQGTELNLLDAELVRHGYPP